MRHARNSNKLRMADQKHDIAMAWLNAGLQRAKKMPSLKKLTERQEKKGGMSLDQIAAKINAVRKVED